eukprot:EG_transcript_53540
MRPHQQGQWGSKYIAIRWRALGGALPAMHGVLPALGRRGGVAHGVAEPPRADQHLAVEGQRRAAHPHQLMVQEELQHAVRRHRDTDGADLAQPLHEGVL